MKKVIECKEYFKDILTNCLVEDAIGKSIFDSAKKAMFETICNTLKFVYGEDFENLKPLWTQETLNEYYSKIA